MLQVWLYLTVIITIINGQYHIPDIKLTAFSPRGFRAILPNDPDTRQFAFHGKVNQDIKETEPGDFFGETQHMVDGQWIYENKDVKLNINDKVNYWVFVQNGIFGYRKSNQVWTVTEILPTATACAGSRSLVTGLVTICKDTVVFEDQFDGPSIDTSKWTVEQYIAAGPDYEFLSYEKDYSVLKVENGALNIIPKLRRADQLTGTLDLRNGCTRIQTTNTVKPRCIVELPYLLQNPIISGRIVSKIRFSYVDIEIKATLPGGHWMFPEIYLEDERENRLVIAYSRGNAILIGNNNDDIGGKLLFGGPMMGPREPVRSSKLSSYKQESGPLSSKSHVYRLRWTPEQIELFIDGQAYGSISADSVRGSSFAADPPAKGRLVLGLGVGGMTDFPDGYITENNVLKPWINYEQGAIKYFYENQTSWLPTWSGKHLVVEYVRVKTI